MSKRNWTGSFISFSDAIWTTRSISATELFELLTSGVPEDQLKATECVTPRDTLSGSDRRPLSGNRKENHPKKQRNSV